MRGFDNFQNASVREREFVESGSARLFMRQVFTNMSLGLLITALSAYFVATNQALMTFFYSGITRYVVMFAPLIFVIVLASRIHKMSFTNASLTFAAYSLVNGISLAFIFWMFEMSGIVQTFAVTAGTFGAMALIGWTSKMDLSRIGSVLWMALIGLIIASVVNVFLGSPMMDFIISGAGVLIFSGLTAWDVQKLLRIGAHADPESDSTRKVALMGALTLYLDFINLFLFLLRFFGGGRD
ncbi:Bax inhibitor-1/YccA family protein [Pontibacter sp. G13]|uniref:Bax inhibitor-1/YccA family protein n=1 Tax=Pontibacter sp. G13 TaxID=3074898 RepID=UPI00288B48C7|nr:Bax inhibitor-1/YccA family protein [Pontibacter sp. G13]WNJ21034.1 Bax inhibitor-1/YccA family protein [Pontibacter sp. G13]